MIIRELLERLRAADSDAEAWVGVPTPQGGALWRPLEDVQAAVPEDAGTARMRCVLLGRERAAADEGPAS